MPTPIDRFRLNVAERLADGLGEDFIVRRKDWTIGRLVNGRREHICLGVNGKWSPALTLDLRAGIFFPEVHEVEARMGLERKLHHIHVWSMNGHAISCFPYDGADQWNATLDQELSKATVDALVLAASQLCRGLFERVRDVRDARNMIAAEDPLVVTPFWEAVLPMDLALDEYDRFWRWIKGKDYPDHIRDDISRVMADVERDFNELPSVKAMV